jgi:eukaryotic-like serine/threonine-protein kinase
MSPEARRLGRYELIEVIGHGAMGVVYKAHDSFLDRIVAVKTYRQDVPITDDIKRRFEREVRTASKLVHPNIVVVLDGGLEQGVPYLAMEFVDGPTLGAEMTRRGRMPTDEAVGIIVEIAEGLAYAHARGVVHRDLKPANILLANGHPKIADFGVAKLMSAGTSATTTPVGTPSYMAPEQIEGRPVDVRTDVFALAIVAYEVLTGKAPFAGEGWTQVLYQIMHVDPLAPRAVDPTLPAAVDHLIAEALAKDPTKRTPNVQTFAAQLRAAFAAERTAIVVPPPSLGSSAPPSQPPSGSPPSPASGPPPAQFEAEFEAFRELAPRRKQKSSSPMIAVVAVVVLLAAILGFVVARRFGPTPVLPPPEATPAPEATALIAAPATAASEPTAPPRPTAPPPTVAPRPTAVPEQPTPRPKPTAAPKPTAVPKPTRAEPTPAPQPTEAPPPAAPPPAANANPTIDIISDPPGAEVKVNGTVRGRTPLRISDLDPGSYDFEVVKEGYTPYHKTARLEAESDYTMKVTLPTTVNSLRVLSQPPGVSVTVNGEPKGKTPITLSGLPSGHYEVVGELEGYSRQTVAVDLKDGELQEVRFTFGVTRP